MKQESVELLRSYMAIEEAIKAKKAEMGLLEGKEGQKAEFANRGKEFETLLAQKERIRVAIKTLKQTTRSSDFAVFYIHIVNGYSLTATAKQMFYSRSGVVKICNKLKKILR